MSRIIKFRAWGAKNPIVSNEQEMIYNIRLATPFEELNNFFEGLALTFMQFTGLYDKNGVEIFEGDIVSNDTYDPVEIGEIEFLGGAFVCLDIPLGFSFSPTNDESDSSEVDVSFSSKTKRDFEVIGNIHQNPELLK